MKNTDIKLGYNCNNNCIHCVIADQRTRCRQQGRANNRSAQEYVSEMIDSRNRGFESITFTGGEPLIRKDILYLLKYAQKLGFIINMQTNGRAFYYKEYAQKFIPFNIYYCIALHGPNAKVHDSITRVNGSFHQTTTGIRNLIKCGATYVMGKTVISSFNYFLLPQIADTFLNLGMDAVNFAFPHANGNAWKYFDDVVPYYSEIISFVHESIKRFEDYNLKHTCHKEVDFEAIPLCLMVGYEKYVAELAFLNNEARELKQLDMGTQDWNVLRKQIKSKFSQCKTCIYDSICEGVWKEYPLMRGDKEFKPVLKSNKITS